MGDKMIRIIQFMESASVQRQSVSCKKWKSRELAGNFVTAMTAHKKAFNEISAERAKSFFPHLFVRLVTSDTARFEQARAKHQLSPLFLLF